jgi:hypothetical protein
MALAHLTRALSIVLPTPVETSLLQACLWTREPARQAWVTYRECAGDLRTSLVKDRRGLKKLMPLLCGAVERHGLDADESLLTLVRTAYLRAGLRSKTVHRILHDVLHALTTDRISHVVLDGAALAEPVYGDPALRHCATIELLLRAEDVPRAASRLAPLGCTPEGIDGASRLDPLVLSHESGLPIELRSSLLLKRDHPIPLDGLLAASLTETIAGILTRVLSPSDRLLDVCLRGFFSSGRVGLGWVPDGWHVLNRFADLDWNLVLKRAHEGQLTLPLLTTLGYLSEGLHAPIPVSVMDHLRNAAMQADPVRGERVLGAAVAGNPGFATRLLGIGGGWGPRLAVARWMAFPSRSYVRSIYEVAHPWQMPFYYLYRPIRFVARRLSALGR